MSDVKMTAKEFGRAVAQLIDASTFPGSALDAVMAMREISRALTAGEIELAKAAVAESSSRPSDNEPEK